MDEISVALSNVNSPEALQLFSEHDDFMINFLGDDKIYYTRYNESENLNAVWLARRGDKTVGGAAYRVMSSGTGELKRMFVKSEYRRRGISKLLLASVEEYAKRRGDRALHLGTRSTLEPAVTLYRNSGFTETYRNGLYVEMEKSLK